MNARAFALVLGAVIISILAASAGWLTHQFTAQDPAVEATSNTAPEFSLTDDAGQTHSLQDYRGKLVLLNFWATWCAPCVEEMPMLFEMQQQYSDQGFQVLGLTVDKREPAREFADELGVNYPLLGDHRSVVAVQDAYGENRLPFSVLIGRDGQILWRYAGVLKREDLTRRIEAAL